MIVKRTLYLTGPHKGKTGQFGKVNFVDGKAVIEVAEADAEKLCRSLYRNYKIVQEGQLEDEGDAQNVSSETETDTNGSHEGDSDSGSKPEGDQPTVGQEDGDAQLHDKDGQADTPAPEVNERLVNALGNLDPAVDAHWTKLGKPAMEAVEGFYGSADITRADIDAAAPGLTRQSLQAK